jgi:hypothetical protein
MRFAKPAKFYAVFEKSTLITHRKASHTRTEPLTRCIRRAENEIPLCLDDITTQTGSESGRNNELG